MDDLTDIIPQHGGKDDLRMARVLQDVNLWRDHQWSEHRPRQSKTTSGEQR